MKRKLNLSGVRIDTWVRLVLFVICIVNIVLEMFDKPIIPIDNEKIRYIVETICYIAANGAGFWYNNSFTDAAQDLDAQLHGKFEVITEDKYDENIGE